MPRKANKHLLCLSADLKYTLQYEESLPDTEMDSSAFVYRPQFTLIYLAFLRGILCWGCQGLTIATDVLDSISQ